MYVKVRVTPGAKKETLEEVGQSTLEVSVKEKAERNLANRRVLELLSEYFQVPRNTVRIINGHQSRTKMISIGESR